MPIAVNRWNEAKTALLTASIGLISTGASLLVAGPLEPLSLIRGSAALLGGILCVIAYRLVIAPTPPVAPATAQPEAHPVDAPPVPAVEPPAKP